MYMYLTIHCPVLIKWVCNIVYMVHVCNIPLLHVYKCEMMALHGRVVLCCFVFLLCCVALPCLSEHLMDD